MLSSYQTSHMGWAIKKIGLLDLVLHLILDIVRCAVHDKTASYNFVFFIFTLLIYAKWQTICWFGQTSSICFMSIRYNFVCLGINKIYVLFNKERTISHLHYHHFCLPEISKKSKSCFYSNIYDVAETIWGGNDKLIMLTLLTHFLRISIFGSKVIVIYFSLEIDK